MNMGNVYIMLTVTNYVSFLRKNTQFVTVKGKEVPVCSREPPVRRNIR
jgi:hypothetical protein